MVLKKTIKQSVKGLSRKINKDATLIFNNEKYLLLILFDGVSSSENAKDCIKSIKKFIKRNINKYIINNDLSLQKLIYDANIDFLKQNIEDGFTTCSAIYIQNGSNIAKILNLGDSRIYGISRQHWNILTTDDIDPSGRLIKCLGMHLPIDSLNEIIITISEDSKLNFLLCSDGFYNIMESDKILFHSILHLSYGATGIVLKKNLKKAINKKNIDDATYIYLVND